VNKNWILGVDFVYPLATFTKSDLFRSVIRPNHMGLDFAGTVGQEVLNSVPGTVQAVYPAADPGGMTVDVVNKDLAVDPVQITYSHLDLVRVRVGQVVTMGQILGSLAAVPKEAPRPHVHLQIRRWVDPEIVMQVPKKYP